VPGHLEDGAFREFPNALCKLSAEMVEMQSGVSWNAVFESESLEDLAGLSPRLERHAIGIR
jgi:hypothetical protein